ncbi:MAG: hypothetical protein A3E91_03830 [Candidatus Moranbacteria bacterium RIFCSPHIGHO2_12_FULL_40_10]|nr:MAG: hypothetical protein A3E91_03830 [Candidatus Moranbacteria bacterium RIFCSPHIGHO2_12_FULL_40_10]
MVVARKIAYNVVFNVIAKILSTILALIGIGFITRYLGKEGFGNYATVLAFFAFFSSFSDMGLYSVATREISRAGADEEKIMGNVFSLRLVSSLAVFLIFLFFIGFLPYERDVKAGIIIAGIAFVFSSGYSVLNGIFQKNLAMDKVALAEFIGKIIQVGFIILAVKKNLGFTAIMLSLLLYMIFNFAVIYKLSQKYIKFKIHADIAYWKKFLKKSLPMGISVMITFFYFKADTIMLSLMKTNADVGIYNAAYKVIENITFFPAMIAGLILPLMSRYIFSEREKFEDIADKTFKVLLILIVPVVVGTLFLADKIIGLIGGAGFSESANVLRILVFALFFIFFGNFFNNILLVSNLQKKLMAVLSFCAAFNIIANLILIPLYSYKGAAVTSVLTELLVVSLALYLIWKNINYRPKAHFLGRILVSGLTMAIFLFFFQKFNFFLLAIGSAGIYMLFLWLTKAVASEEIISIISKRGAEVSPIQREEII